ncbi:MULTISPECIES: hypothetical protein [unclassified Mesorhizobium]|uniref:hypothetical protein n=1 Tax=unclassified Mesorhizobium TaxID=325217 RepID=UPI000FCB1D48|nr:MULTISPECIES: hypothetical protein [unclassified Mesorhizobium]TIT75371.1 MAG: hypothetical protein E5W57_22735 [Mesorhizobium sp.]TGP21950.1 hypothetical protein EN874_020960 [Mesorhizobium sp. M1D.F.Ca.ET.231.01.1.1]TGP30335.1 hypothetical protein EN877_19340 [Mesorhizobium sp. M1D.F.Ca.ET.234.01.1.1]TGS44411.1 hypothetical protein EN827_19335 [Mesorhizobium sp. M1D.F.Ca.ET.184.01.1.1]TGS60451.1 hypothetical protein EN826_019335 [Mesorhizobium sp. M1D.F.Ca.ET.183.01.1.1]
MPIQYVVVSFDGCVDLDSWSAWAAFAAKHPSLRLTFFVSGTSFLSDERRRLYCGPGSEPGKARIRFGGTQSQLAARAGYMDALFRSGHEIASHAVGHLDGAAWTSGQWLDEFSLYDRLVDNFPANNGLGPEHGLAFGSRDIKGFRAPFLSTGPGLAAALAARGFRYDASSAGRAGDWPTKNRDNVWKFRLASIPLRDCRLKPLSMDYNLFVAQSLGNPDVLNDPRRLEDDVVEAYLNYFKKNYVGNRAPIHIGHHFTDYVGKAYERALMRFIGSVIHRPDVRFCTYSELADALDEMPGPGRPATPAVVAEEP